MREGERVQGGRVQEREGPGEGGSRRGRVQEREEPGEGGARGGGAGVCLGEEAGVCPSKA